MSSSSDSDLVGAACVEHPPIPANPPDDERGAVLVFTAMCMIVLLWASAMGIDVGFSVWGTVRRRPWPIPRRSTSPATSTWRTTTPLLPAFELPELETGQRRHRAGAGSNTMLTVTAGLWSGGAFNVPSYGCALLSPPNPLEPPYATRCGSLPGSPCPRSSTGVAGPDWSRHGSKRDKHGAGHS